MSARRRVSFQGERGAYSEGAALALFPGAETVPCGSFSEAARAAEAGRSDCAVLPVENSLAGSVGESHAILRDTPLRIVAETYHRIAHCLIGRCAEAEARTVYSHPQALAQCRRYIEARGLRRVPTYDTAGSVAMVAGMGEAGAVCIASAGAARLHGVPVIEEGIADDAENYTRFVVLSSSDPEPAGGDKTSVLAQLRHESGALHALLGAIAARGINLTRIESRPGGGGAWEYDFFIDMECGAGAARAALAGAAGARARVLGSYAAAAPPRTRGAGVGQTPR